MLGEIDGDFYCSNGFICISGDKPNICFDYGGSRCPNCRHKHPTPSEYKEEYGEEWTGAVYVKCTVPACTEKCNNYWNIYPNRLVAIAEMCDTGLKEKPIIICAATPFGKPDDDWRPA